jgi:hypothetical protein
MIMMETIQMPTKTDPNQRRSPHIGNYDGAHVDYNGVGIWSAEAIQKRYRKYADAFGAIRPTLHQDAIRRAAERGFTP